MAGKGRTVIKGTPLHMIQRGCLASYVIVILACLLAVPKEDIAAETNAPVITLELKDCPREYYPDIRCPLYTVEIYEDGRVAYEGLNEVRILGKEEWFIDPSVVHSILEQAEDLGFPSSKDNTQNPGEVTEEVYRKDCVPGGRIGITREGGYFIVYRVWLRIGDQRRITHPVCFHKKFYPLITRIQRDTGVFERLTKPLPGYRRKAIKDSD